MDTKQVLKRIKRIFEPINDPNFMIIGAQKSATSSLHYYLNQYSGMNGSTPKELHYFSRDIYFGKSQKEYRKSFKGNKNATYFEASPSYLYVPESAKEIHRHYPNIKLIVILRNPIQRAYSAWNHYRQIFETKERFTSFSKRPRRTDNLLFEMFFRDRKEFPKFRECINIELDLISKQKGVEPALLRKGLYLQQLEEYWRFFEHDQVLILGFKDLINDTDNTLNRVCRFLGAEEIDWSKMDREPRNAHKYGTPINEEDKFFLEAFYAKPNSMLFDKVGVLNW